MKRRQLSIGLVFGAMAVFIAGLSQLDGNRIGQALLAVIFAVAVVLIVRWGNSAAA
jgi:hypothetical protein